MEMTITPTARELVDIRAIAASPLIRLLLRMRRSSTAARMTTGIAAVRGARFRAAATARAPNPTWDRPSPIMEYRLSTRLTPRRAEQSATREPTKARTMKG